MSEPRILLLDLETSPMLIASWRQWDTSAVYVVRNTYILMCQWQWVGERQIHVKSVWDYPLYKKDQHNDFHICGVLRNLLNQADIVVAHNGDSFDVPLTLGRMWAHGLPPPSPFKQVDTKKIAKNMRLDSRALDALGKLRGVGRKLTHEGAAMWEAAVERKCPKAQAKMERYGVHDIRLLGKIYPLLRPYAKPSQHPDLSLYTQRPGCPACASSKVKMDGTRILQKRRVQQWQCQEDGCGRYFHTP